MEIKVTPITPPPPPPSTYDITGVLGKTLPEGRPGLAEVNKNLALTIGELSNIAAEALTFLEDETVMDLSFNERTRVRALRKRLEEACRSVS